MEKFPIKLSDGCLTPEKLSPRSQLAVRRLVFLGLVRPRSRFPFKICEMETFHSNLHPGIYLAFKGTEEGSVAGTEIPVFSRKGRWTTKVL